MYRENNKHAKNNARELYKNIITYTGCITKKYRGNSNYILL